ncbi:MAG: hypothetical protein MUC88_14780 [Planctomycetes bacterium]|jgi:hypothetical protein|nr:hypothetical protein [Planctomycetota bacterium]
MRNVFMTCLTIVVVPGVALAAEVQVNVRTSGAQANAAVAAGPHGGAIIVWSSYYSTAGRSNDILARRLDVAGAFLGSEFPVNTAVEGNQTEPAVAVDPQGRCAVVWQGPGPSEEDIFLRLFSADGAAVTGELLVNLDVAGRQLSPVVAAGGDGTLVVAWESRETTLEGERAVIRAQRFDPNGAGLGGSILVDTGTLEGRYPEVATDRTGRFAIVWMRDRSSHPIFARLFDANGIALTDPWQVNTASIASITRPAVAMNASGSFVIAWDGDPQRASDDDIHARCYDPNGVPRGEPVLVNTSRPGAQQWPQVAIGDANEFLIVWEHDSGGAHSTEIAGRYFDPEGVPVGEQFQLNTTILDAQRYPDVVPIGEGSFLAAWESFGQDGSGYGIFMVEVSMPAPAEPDEPV